MLRLEGIDKFYGKNKVINNFNYTFEPNIKYALRGKSGAGKSTILNIIAQFEKPSEGSITYNKTDISKIKKNIYYRDILGYLFQNYALIDNDTVFDNMKIACTKRHSKSELLILMTEALQKVNLSKKYLNKSIYELSGGEQQRVSIARMLLKNTHIILVDEPTAALDRSNSLDILNSGLSGLLSSENIMIVASHDPLVFEWADKVIDL